MVRRAQHGRWLAAAVFAPLLLAATAPSVADYAADARALDKLLADNYAYLDRLPGGAIPASPVLDAERDAVHDRDSLLHYAEDKLTALADHHAITGSSFRDDWALVPSFCDLWVEGDGRITAVRAGSPAARAGIVAGSRLTAVDGVALAPTIAAFWARLGLAPAGERAGYAARVLAAGRRDRPRTLAIDGRPVTLASLYANRPDRPPITVSGTTIRINNALGDSATVAAFDAAMAAIPSAAPVTIDLTDTASGGNTSVARAMMGWFVRKPSPYQVHNLPAEARETGIERQWIEEVLPRPGKYHAGPVRVRVGRWTGSMGEGLAVGFAAIGGAVCGGPMAGLVGAVYDFTLPASGLVVKFPAERVYTVAGVPRERFVPAPDARCR